MKKLLLSFFLFSLTALASHARDFPYSYITMSVENGLSQPNVTALLTDKRGTLWIGTRNGLNRFDRQDIQAYTSRRDDPLTLPDNLVYGLLEDNQGGLWTYTSRGLARYLPREDLFERVLDFPVHSSLVEEKGILFGGDGVLYRFSSDKDEPERIFPFGKEAEGDPGFRVLRILALKGGDLLLGTERNGIYRFSPGQEARVFVAGPGQSLIDLYRTSSGQILAAFFGDGFHSYSEEGVETKWYTTKNSELTNDYVQDFAEFDGNLWVATDGGGICLQPIEGGPLRPMLHIPGNPESIPSNSVTVLYPGSPGVLWAGTVKHGFFQVRKNYIRSFSGPFYGLTDNAVTSLYREPDGCLWVGTDGGGIHKFNPISHRFTYLPGTKGKILSIAGFDDRRLLESVYMEGFFLVDRKTGRKTPFIIVNEEVNNRECFRGYLPRVGKVAPDKLYFLGSKAWVYRISSGVFSLMGTSEDDIQTDNMRMACSDGVRSYFYRANRVLYADITDDILRPLTQVTEDEKVTAVANGQDGTIWIGTDRGLGRLDKESGEIVPLKTPLLDRGVSALEYETGRLWICSGNHLVTYLVGEDRFIPWSASDGFKPNDIKMLFQNSRDPYFLYMGGSGGLAQVDRRIPVPGSESPSIFLDRLYLNGNSALSKMDGIRIKVPWNYQSLSASFLVKDDDMFNRKLFRYIVQGDQSRTIETYDPMLTFSSLSPGEYQVSVSCLTKGGGFTEPVLLLEVSVLPPWYHSTLFYLLLGLLFAGFLFWLIRNQRRRQENESKNSMAMFLEGMLRDPEPIEEETVPVASDPEFLQRLDKAILEHISDPDLDVRFLTEYLGMSRTALYAKVKQETGVGVKDYINRIRIERSVDMLLHTNKTINEISYEVGFSYPRYFSTSFKNMKGVTPTRFKQENRS